MSRGIPHKAAERMIIEGFFEQVFERIPVESVKEDLRTAVERKLLGII
jgi:Fe-S cluster assembly protein SufD